MPPKNTLGKGLGAIFPDLIDELAERPSFIMCSIEELTPNKFQSRKHFDPLELDVLVSSIRESGIIQPIVVRKSGRGYEIIAGERRWRAAQKAGLKKVPIVIRQANDIEVAEISLIENVQRADLNPIEEAEAYDALSRNFGLSQDEIAARVGKDRSTIANALRLLKLPEEVRRALARRDISAGHARAILSLASREEQLIAARVIQKRGLSVRQAELLTKKLGKSRAAGKKGKDIHLSALEGQLAAKLMTKVVIQAAKKGGMIQIRFHSPADLDRLVKVILGE
ncbi:MAG: ParB/RepB/Spo0J family partition protein [Syntrophales bacterium]